MSTAQELVNFAMESFGMQQQDGIFENKDACLIGALAPDQPKITIVADFKEGFIDILAPFASTEEMTAQEALEKVGMGNRLGIQIFGPYYAVRAYVQAEFSTKEIFANELALITGVAKALRS